ncbi:hypothetical protein MYX84_02110 [Acidobacteria bacterium AH-259-O06]|nr:hypothetical protein [Acidobacteria bacterium AH-259-O06]
MSRYLEIVEEWEREQAETQPKPEPGKQNQTLERIREEVSREGKAVVVTVKGGRIRIVKDAKTIDPKKVVAVWHFRRVQRFGHDWIIGQRDDGSEIAWPVKRVQEQ